VTGDRTGTERWASVVFDERSGHVQGWDRLETTRALGVAALLERDATVSVECLRAVWDHTQREHVDEPGVFAVAPDLVDALLGAGDVAAEEYGAMGLDFDHARTLLGLGESQRRARKRTEARLSIDAAISKFDLCGCPGWVLRAQTELDRVSGRRPTSHDQLTPSEQQVADLAAGGLSNKEIASRLFVSVYTVEAHLTHTYAKLGVRSRVQLARRLHEASTDESGP
jgi:DNA-binding CsgD family transcriptional regulator